jgi:hypothetical protein
MARNGEIQGGLPKELAWDFDLPIFDRFKTQNMVIVLGIVVLILAPIFLASVYAGILLAVVILLTVLFRSIIELSYRQVRFRVDERGAGFTTRSKQRDIYKTIGSLLLLTGLARSSTPSVLMGNQQLQTSGAGIGSNVGWNNVRQVLLYPKERVVLLKWRWFVGAGLTGFSSVRLYCTPGNYETVAAMSLEYSEKR